MSTRILLAVDDWEFSRVRKASVHRTLLVVVLCTISSESAGTSTSTIGRSQRGMQSPRRSSSFQKIFVIDHPQKHHGAACSPMLRLLATAFPESSGERTREKD